MNIRQKMRKLVKIKKKKEKKFKYTEKYSHYVTKNFNRKKKKR